MFSEKIKIKYSDLAPDRKASIAALLRYFQNAGIDHSASAGYPLERLCSEGRAWILISMNADFFRRPDDGEVVELSTYTPSFEKVYGYRCFVLKDENNEVIAKASSLWIFLNTDSGRPARVFEDICEKYGSGDGTGFEFIRREPQFEISDELCTLTVGSRDIDTNNHVNNVRLEEFAAEAVPDNKQIKKAVIFYRSSFHKGDTVHVCSNDTGECIQVHLRDDDGKSRTSAQFFYK